MRHATRDSLHVMLSGMSGQNCLELVSNAQYLLVNAPCLMHHKLAACLMTV